MAEDAAAPEDAPPQPAANPDAQTAVNDFLDYTEFFPSDLIRSLRLIGDLDQTYVDATQAVHQLTVKYGKLPALPAGERDRPDPVKLRRDIAHALDRAIYARESSYAEASRLYEVAERHKHRIGIIKRKLQAQPEPPSRDPTPVPVSPQAPRALHRGFVAPHLRLTFDGRHANSTVRSRDRKKLLGVRIRTASFSDSDDSDARSTVDLAAARRLKDRNNKTPRTQKGRVRPPGSGTNVHSSVAGISTSNALARLSPPPDNPRPGSRWAPWLKLTEYEMAVLRKKMKKNAVWTPSETMIKRVLESTGRGQEAYEREKKRCEEAGEELLDEEPAAPSLRSANPTVAPETMPAIDRTPMPAATATPTDHPSFDAISVSIEPHKDADMGDDDSIQDAFEDRDVRQSKRDSRRRQAARDVQELEDTTRKIKEAANWMQELSFSTAGTGKRPVTKYSNKRKRDSTPQATADTPAEATREPSLASQDSGTKPPEPKRLRINMPAAADGASTPQNLTPVALSPGSKTPVPFPDLSKMATVHVPLAPAGSGSPKSGDAPAAGSKPGTPMLSPAVATYAEAHTSPATAPTTTALTASAPSNVTAASSRPRRESVVPPKEKPPSPVPAPAPVTKKQKAATPGPETAPLAPRNRSSRPTSSRGHVPTPKAQSEEPKPIDGQNTRELRRHSIFSQSAIAASTAAPTRTSTRRKAPPKGEITNGEGGQKTVTNVNRAQGNKNKKKKKPEEDSEPADEIDQDEERYCICDDVSYGSMILCDNHCEKEWFHLDCVGLKDGELPARRAKWYCPDCREALGTDAYGNPKVPPPLPGRRGNR